jgi:hypothetical protein
MVCSETELVKLLVSSIFLCAFLLMQTLAWFAIASLYLLVIIRHGSHRRQGISHIGSYYFILLF